jgi:excisionase family DNA binding protein
MPDSISAPPQTEPATYSVHQLARRLGVSVRTIHRMKDAGTLPPAIRFGKLLKWPRKTIEAWLDEQAESARR